MRLVQTGNVGVAEYLDKPNNKKWISEDTFDRLHCEEVLPGDILISRLPEPAGRACIMPLLGAKMITAVDCTIVRTAPDMSNKFLVQYLSSQAYFDDVNICLAGGTRQRISRGNLANFDVPIPVKKSEQDAIGMFFGYLDNLITLHQRQPFLHSTPEISLTVQLIHPFYTSSWEQRKLGELVDRVVRKNINNESTLPLTISAQYGLVDQITYFNNRVASRDVSNYYFNIAVPHIRGFRSNLRCTGLPDSYHRSFPQRYKRYRFRLFGQCRCGRIVHPADPTNPCYPNQRK